MRCCGVVAVTHSEVMACVVSARQFLILDNSNFNLKIRNFAFALFYYHITTV